MVFAVQDALIEVRDSPAQRDVEIKAIGQSVCRFLCVRIAPGLERCQELSLCIKGHVAMHHGADADGADTREGEAVPLFDRLL